MAQAMDNVKDVRHGTVCFESAGTVLLVDPYRLPAGTSPADIIVVTHAHADHYSPNDLRAVMKPDTQFYTAGRVAWRLQEALGVSKSHIHPLNVGDVASPSHGVTVRAVLSENANHPSGEGFGAVVGFGGFTYYLSGDTDVLDENVACDVLFCVCDGVYNMKDFTRCALEQIARMKTPPALTIPYHYDKAPRPNNGEQLAEILNAGGFAARVFAE